VAAGGLEVVVDGREAVAAVLAAAVAASREPARLDLVLTVHQHRRKAVAGPVRRKVAPAVPVEATSKR